jgi:hypothetical protein
MIDRLLFVLLCGLGVLLYVTLVRQIVALRERVETLMVRTERLRRAVKRIARQTPATRLGHMHRIGASLVSLDPEPKPQWIIVDPGGRVLSTMPAKKIVNRMAGVAADAADLTDDTIVRQHSNDPAGDHSYKETFRQSYLEDAELAAQSVFPVCALRETACGYDILLCR